MTAPQQLSPGAVFARTIPQRFHALLAPPAEYPVLWTGMNAERGYGGCNPPPPVF
jgi:hypothetical protein